MNNMKIKVNTESESKQAKSLLESLGFDIDFSEKGFKYPYLFAYVNGMHVTGDNREGHFKNKNNKEITLPQLRDLVVLKRNDRKDANVIDPEYDASLYLDSKGDLFVFHLPAQKWKESNLNGEEDVMARLKPIEKPMKEYLIKSGDGKYLLTHHDSIGAIEIPEGRNIAVIEDSKVKFYSKYTSADLDHLGKDLIWMRPSLPEELPFIDDEPSQSLNDQYAEIEKVRQSAWQKQEGGSHYKTLKIQPMQYALENKLDYAQANVVKYVTRHADKNGKEDLLKAIHNLELMIEFYYGGGE